jgi:hypothetical protein
MPVTPALLSKLRETLGDEAASELVTWVERSSERDLTQLRDLAELYYQRFDARLEQRLAETKAELRVEAVAQRNDLIKWMFVFWAGTIIPLAALMVALVKL